MKYYEQEYDDSCSDEYECYSDGDEFYEDNEEIEGGAYSDDENYYYDSSEDFEGGAYQLDYIDGMYGNGRSYGGVVYGGGRIQKGSHMDYETYEKLMLSKKKRPIKVIQNMYNLLQEKNGRPTINFNKMNKKIKTTRPRKQKINKYCDKNKKTYVYQSGYDKYCIEKEKKRRRQLKEKINKKCPYGKQKTYVYQSGYDKYCLPDKEEQLGSGMYKRRLLRKRRRM